MDRGLADALRSNRIGTQAALQLLRVATPDTQAAWLKRADQRTFKHLRQEVEIAQTVGELTGEELGPPSAAEIRLMEAIERDVTSGAAARRVMPHIDDPDAETPDPVPDRPKAEGDVSAPYRTYLVEYDRLWKNGAAIAVVKAAGRGDLEGARVAAAAVRTSAGDPDAERPDEADASSTDAAVRISAGELDTEVEAPVESEENASAAELAVRISAGDSDGDAGPGVRDGPHRPSATTRYRARVPESVALQYRMLRDLYAGLDIDLSFVEFVCTMIWSTHYYFLGKSDKWELVYRRDGYRCRCPVCSRRTRTLHHLIYRGQGGGDEDANVIGLCEFCHLQGEHEGRLKAVPPSTKPTFILGRQPILIVCNRDKHEVEPTGKATGRAWRTILDATRA